ncbi:aminoglycoside 6'-N-acetyltransferase [Streptococcus pneumoniae]|nr:aminoglycoside 6'-N-acetyltransferase [Streptococcus pneumoniae]
MDGITKDFIKTAKLMKQLWPQLTDKEAIDEVKKYTNGKNTAIFTEVEGDTIVGLALCSLRFDYVEGCKYSPVGFLEGIIVDEEYRLKDIAKNLVQNVRNGRKIKDVRNLQVTVL